MTEQEIDKIKRSKFFPNNGNFVGNGGSSLVPLEYFLYSINKVSIQNGLWLEFGVWNGNTITELAKFTNKIYGFDSFKGLPENWKKSERDILPKSFFGQNGRVPNHLKNNKKIEIVVGWFNETLPKFIELHKESCALIHIDCDLYSSTKTVLDQLQKNNQIVPGTVIMFDELIGYENFQEHELKALLESGIKYEYIGHTEMQASIMVL